jgi:hypothetical protein
MAIETYRGVVRGSTVVLEENGTPLTEGTEVLVTPVAGGCGTSAAVIAAMESSPQVPAAWVDELEQCIAEGRRPPTQGDPFQEGK